MTDFPMSGIKAVFMDIGGVFLTNAWDHISRRKAADVFHYDYEAFEQQHNFIYNVFEIGSISLDEYLDTVLFYKKQDFTKEEYKAFMLSQSVELPDMLAWAKEWKKRVEIPVFAVNNESAELNDYRIKKFGLHDLFDGFFSSCYVNARKPDPRIFQTAVKIAHVAPEECLYFDDRKMLTEAAKKVGIKTVHHKNFETTKNILEYFIKK